MTDDNINDPILDIEEMIKEKNDGAFYSDPAEDRAQADEEGPSDPYDEGEVLS